MNGIRNWGFVVQHMAVAAIMAVAVAIALSVIDWWSARAVFWLSVAGVAFWFGREVWDHRDRGRLGPVLTDPQALAEWAAPSLVFAACLAFVGIVT